MTCLQQPFIMLHIYRREDVLSENLNISLRQMHIYIYMLSRSGGLKVERARSKAENWGSLMTSSYSANCDRTF